MGAFATTLSTRLVGETGFEPALTPLHVYGLEDRCGTPPEFSTSLRPLLSTRSPLISEGSPSSNSGQAPLCLIVRWLTQPVPELSLFGATGYVRDTDLWVFKPPLLPTELRMQCCLLEVLFLLEVSADLSRDWVT